MTYVGTYSITPSPKCIGFCLIFFVAEDRSPFPSIGRKFVELCLGRGRLMIKPEQQKESSCLDEESSLKQCVFLSKKVRSTLCNQNMNITTQLRVGVSSDGLENSFAIASLSMDPHKTLWDVAAKHPGTMRLLQVTQKKKSKQTNSILQYPQWHQL